MQFPALSAHCRSSPEQSYPNESRFLTAIILHSSTGMISQKEAIGKGPFARRIGAEPEQGGATNSLTEPSKKRTLTLFPSSWEMISPIPNTACFTFLQTCYAKGNQWILCNYSNGNSRHTSYRKRKHDSGTDRTLFFCDYRRRQGDPVERSQNSIRMDL